MKVLIYDPALCCSTGLCGPEPDPAQIAVNETIMKLGKQGVEGETPCLILKTRR